MEDDLLTFYSGPGKPTDRHERPDCNPARVKEFRSKHTEAKRQWFDEKFGENQLNLTVLCTHPEFRRRGAGTRLVEWGKFKALEAGMAVTLFSSPMGRKLYSKLGFTEVGDVKIQVPGEEEVLYIQGMTWEPNCHA
jgi:ribosomal protein S18 acetylase RimI-like enzyme